MLSSIKFVLFKFATVIFSFFILSISSVYEASLWIKLQFNFGLFSLMFLSGINYYLLRLSSVETPTFVQKICDIVEYHAHTLSWFLCCTIVLSLILDQSRWLLIIISVISYAIFELRISHLRGSEHQDRANICFSLRYGIALGCLVMLSLIGYSISFNVVVCVEVFAIAIVCLYLKADTLSNYISGIQKTPKKSNSKVLLKTIVNGAVALPFVYLPAVASWFLTSAELKVFFIMLQIFNAFIIANQYIANEVVKHPDLINVRSGLLLPPEYLRLISSDSCRLLYIFSLTSAGLLGGFYFVVQGIMVNFIALYLICLLSLIIVIFTRFPILYLLAHDKDLDIIIILGGIVGLHNVVFFIEDLTASHVFYALVSMFCLIRLVANWRSKIITKGIRE